MNMKNVGSTPIRVALATASLKTAAEGSSFQCKRPMKRMSWGLLLRSLWQLEAER